MARDQSGGRWRKAGARRGSSVPPKKSKALWRAIRLLAYWGLVISVWASVVLAGVMAYYAYDLPNPTALGVDYRAPGVTLLAADGAVLGTAGPVHAEPVTLDELPVVLPRAVLATEDRRFYLHG
ncbi:MAG: hypothetical protein CFH37_00463, partial [Alphaproteobacteria bacterium MarineAlpha9_Bin7]